MPVRSAPLFLAGSSWASQTLFGCLVLLYPLQSGDQPAIALAERQHTDVRKSRPT